MPSEKSGAFSRSAIPEPPGQGLTSLPFDAATPKGFYGIAGYRVCGGRCVRIDMLERLGDLIRERVFWRPRTPGETRPAGSIDGGGFSVVADMMSLVGCSGEEFAQILRSLGFRMERRARPAPSPTAAPAVEEPAGGVAEPHSEMPRTSAGYENSRGDARVRGPPPPRPMVRGEPGATSSRSGGRGTPGLSGLVHRRPRANLGRRNPGPEPRPAPGRGRPGARLLLTPGKPKEPPTRDKAFDPSSPFAVLGGLRARLSSTKKNA